MSTQDGTSSQAYATAAEAAAVMTHSYAPPKVLVDAAYRTIRDHIAPDHTRHKAYLAWDCHGFYRDKSDELREAVLGRFERQVQP